MAKKDLKAGTTLAPIPAVLVTCGSYDKPNVITIAWTGIVCSEPPKTYISVRKDRYSYEIIKKNREFVINLVNKKLAVTADFCGVRSGKNVDKFAEMHIEKTHAKCVACPIIAQSPLSLECRVNEIIPLGSHDMFIADILNLAVDEQYIDANNRICLDKAMLVAYNHGEYFLLGDKIGKFGYSVMPKADRRKIILGKPKQ